MQQLQRWLDQLALGLLWIAGLALTGMMLVTLFDVVVRNLSEVIPALHAIKYYGTIEIVRYLFLFAMAGAMPWGVERSQVVVELFTQRLSAKARARIDAGFLLGFVVLGALMGYSLIQSGLHAIQTGETTRDLMVPLAPIKFAAAACFLLMAARALLVAIQGLRRGELHVA